MFFAASDVVLGVVLRSEGRWTPKVSLSSQRGFVSGPRELSQPVCDVRTLLLAGVCGVWTGDSTESFRL